MSMYVTRRHFIQTFGTGIGALWFNAALPLKLAYAATPGEKRLLVVILRGAMDGLAAVVPYGDPAYAQARGPMAIPQNDQNLLILNKTFALHKSLQPLSDMYRKKELLVVHAIATPYRDRSHFDAQDLLEGGGDKAHEFTTGWLGRSVAELQNTSGTAIAMGPTVPLILRGDPKVTSWAPSMLPQVDEDLLSRIAHMYQNDQVLLNAINGSEELGSSPSAKNRMQGQKQFIGMMQKAAEFMSNNSGLRVGSIDIGGWDTHANQGLDNGRLAQNLQILADGLATYKQGMGPLWKNTAVLVVTEFGRTVHANGTGGTDHGTGTVAFLLGGSVNGGQVAGDWPGLSKLYEDRDLIPANNLQSLLKGTLQAQLGLSDAQLDSSVFPASRSTPPMKNLFIV